MKFTRTNRSVWRNCVLGTAALALGSSAGSAQEAEHWTKRFRLGFVTGFNIEAEFSLRGDFGVSGIDPGQPGVGGLNHTYDDGYVRLDDTGNAGGVTSNWGYQAASQYDPVNETLTFRGTTSFSQEGSSSSASDEPYYGLDLAYGGRLMDAAGGVLGWELGFRWLPVKFEDRQSLNVTATRVVHRFSTAGIVLPQAPYHGGSSGVGPVIGDVAEALPSETSPGLLTGVRRVKADVMDFRLGPNMQWHLGGRWAASLGGGFALGLVTGDYEFDERITYGDSEASNRGKFGATEFLYGGYAEALLYFRAEENAEIYVGAQFVSMGDMVFSGGGREARVKLGSGIFLSAGIHWIF
jgi:hypothetical protein